LIDRITGEVDDAFTEALAREEQAAHAPEPRAAPYLYQEGDRELLNLAALRFRQAAATCEALAVETVPALRDASIRGVDRYVDEANEFLGRVLEAE
jgi:hypothetical protein